MDINAAFNDAVNYIEDNLCGNIDYEKAALIVGTSQFHFQRMFSLLTGIPVAEYIRRRKLTLAAFDLLKSDEKVIDIALKYGYESHSSFSRAFMQFHGITPSQVRMDGTGLQVCSPIHLQITVNGSDAIRFRLEKAEPFRLFGGEDVIVPMEHKDALDFIRSYGERVVKNGTHNAVNMAAGFPVGKNHPLHLLHGIYFKDALKRTRFMYGWELPGHGVDESFTVVDVPGLTWAVFTYYGEHMESLPKIWTYIYSSWLLTSGYKTVDTVIIEKETWLDDKRESFRAEVWLPVQNRA